MFINYKLILSHLHAVFQIGHKITFKFEIYCKLNVAFIRIAYILYFVSGKDPT
jgi:hypothetical protein